MVTRFLSYGGGIQSTALVLMVLDGEYERPDYVVFADTGSEMPETMETVSKIRELCQDSDLPFITVEKGRPLHEVYHEKNTLPVVGIRSCTDNFKIAPIKRFMRTIVGNGRGKPIAETWLGISTDESRRATPSMDKWSTRRYPLLEKEMSRADCKFYLEKKGWKVVKSGCYLCPYQSPRSWARLNLKHPELFAHALEMESAARANGFRGGLWASRRSIEAFNHSHTLNDFGFEIGPADIVDCDPDGGCFL